MVSTGNTRGRLWEIWRRPAAMANIGVCLWRLIGRGSAQRGQSASCLPSRTPSGLTLTLTVLTPPPPWRRQLHL
jgi:hypothetical protein